MCTDLIATLVCPIPAIYTITGQVCIAHGIHITAAAILAGNGAFRACYMGDFGVPLLLQIGRSQIPAAIIVNGHNIQIQGLEIPVYEDYGQRVILQQRDEGRVLHRIQEKNAAIAIPIGILQSVQFLHAIVISNGDKQPLAFGLQAFMNAVQKSDRDRICQLTDKGERRVGVLDERRFTPRALLVVLP